MARVAGIEIPAGKHVWVSLTYIYGIGDTLSRRILKDANVPENLKVKDLSEDQLSRINSIVDKGYTVEGALKRLMQQNIQRLKEIACYRGARHRRNLPVRGQRTRSNARTRKGPRKTVAGKKIAKVQG
ncbi:MAG TPA: 30S ribosomal protein S13 [Planctomycetota bacterium]|nr:30S ribosomal protein S13 [Planctomycetota bacterium]